MIVKGTFEVTMQGEPPYEEVAGVAFSRARFEKKFSGALEATSTVQMLATRSAKSGGYVALERVTGSLEGRRGTFAAVHLGLIDRGAQLLTIAIVPESGTGGFEGIGGTMKIVNDAGRHSYELDYTFT